jgi:hypothetical protein
MMGNLISELAEGGAKGLFTGIGQMAKDIRTAITGKDPAKEAEAMQKLLEIEFAAQKAQTDINIVEAQSPNLFVSGWRPATGWICVFALAWYYILAPFASWVMSIFDVESTIPIFEAGELMTLLFGLLGIGGMRTYEKIRGVSS